MRKFVNLNRLGDVRTTYKVYVDGSIRIERESKKDNNWFKTHSFNLTNQDIKQINIIYKEKEVVSETKWMMKLKQLLQILKN